MEREQIILLSVIIAASSLLLTSSRRWWVRPWIGRRNRGNLNLINEEFMECEDLDSFKNFMRMDKSSFEKLLKKVEKHITKQSTHLREPISARDRLTITLRFLATGESFQSLKYSLRVGQSTISTMIPEVCQSIYNELKDDYLKVPDTEDQWLNIAAQFKNKWNMPNVLAAMDGKHIVFRAPRSAGSAYFNYKQQHSIVLLALVDADYKFLYVDVGINGRISDEGVYRRSSLCTAIERNLLHFPIECPLPERIMPVPFVIVADAAFPLSNNILKPFPFRRMTLQQRIFNYRLSRARRVVENAFGILTNKWRVLLNPINLSPEKVELITLTCCALHNYLRTMQCEDSGVDRRFTFKYGLSQQGGNRASRSSIDIRNEFLEYVNNEGAVPWQINLA